MATSGSGVLTLVVLLRVLPLMVMVTMPTTAVTSKARLMVEYIALCLAAFGVTVPFAGRAARIGLAGRCTCMRIAAVGARPSLWVRKHPA